MGTYVKNYPLISSRRLIAHDIYGKYVCTQSYQHVMTNTGAAEFHLSDDCLNGCMYSCLMLMVFN